MHKILRVLVAIVLLAIIKPTAAHITYIEVKFPLKVSGPYKKIPHRLVLV